MSAIALQVSTRSVASTPDHGGAGESCRSVRASWSRSLTSAERRAISSMAGRPARRPRRRVPAWRFSSRSRSPVSGVRSWCEALATNARCSSIRRRAVRPSSTWCPRELRAARVGLGRDRSTRPSRSPLPKRRRGVVEPTEREGDRSSDQPADEADRGEHDGAMAASPHQNRSDVFVDLGGVEREAKRPVDRAARGDGIAT